MAERELDTIGGLGHAVKIVLGSPQKDTHPDRDFYCPYQWIGIGNDSKIRKAYGLELWPALLLALLNTKAELLHWQTVPGVALKWVEDENLGIKDF